MKVTKYSEYLNEYYTNNTNTGKDYNSLELQSKINTLSKRKIITLRDEFNFPTIPTIDNLDDDELERLQYSVDLYFLTTVDDVVKEVQKLTDDEIDELGYYLETKFLNSVKYSGDDDEDDEDEFSEDEVIEMVKVLCKEYHFIGFLMDLVKDGMPIEELELLDEGDFEELEESPSRLMKNKNKNKKKRKYMTKGAAELRREKSKRKQDARKNKSKKKRYYKANKTKISAYQKSRSDSIKKGKHKVKKRRKT